MIAKRIIPCLDVKDGMVVKGVQFVGHHVMGEILDLAKLYVEEGADELVFYDITASCENRTASTDWIRQIARYLDIPFCVAGGIRNLKQAEIILNAGADKISINSPALENPQLIEDLAKEFGQQCVVVGVDSRESAGDYHVYQYTGDPNKSLATARKTMDWIVEIEHRGAGEIVLNCMNQDGMKKGYDLQQLKQVRKITNLPLIASGGAGKISDFYEVFMEANVDGALAASVFHSGTIRISELKAFLDRNHMKVRL